MDPPAKPAPQTDPLFREEQRFRQGGCGRSWPARAPWLGLSLGVPLCERVTGSAEGWAAALR
ncbi:MAG: hypothetical protein BRD48_00020 [Bacteroidetes bacterium QS_9_68_14]|nr:MAG: hypothetical protein BRD48_00020 [Bacteroidetes bacterium QS_9_68_14]